MNQQNKNTALLVMDVQESIVGRLENKKVYVEKVKKAVDAAHKNNVDVIYVVVGFHSLNPDISNRNKMFGRIKENMSENMVNPHPVIKLVDGDRLVVKRRVSAFCGSDLEVVLRAKDIHHIVILGVATSGVVLSTLREAADKDYGITVLKDLCSDSDSEIQNVLLEKIFPRQADVVMSDEWIRGIGEVGGHKTSESGGI